MKVNHEVTSFTKICHARPGDVVQLVDSQCVEEQEVYLLAGSPAGLVAMKTAGSLGSSGLYGISSKFIGEFFLVNLQSGVTRPLPHLSSRAIIYRKAEVNLNKALEASRN